MAGKTKLVGKNLEIALKMLHDVTLAMEKAKIPYWLEGGTLLGIIRENRILPWDNDMDISMEEKHKFRLLKVIISLFFQGYRISIRHFARSIVPFKKFEFRMLKIRNYNGFLRKGDVMLDIFVKRRIKDDVYWTVGVKTPVLKSSPIKFCDNLAWHEFEGKKYMIPEDFDGYLTYRYGDWITPVKTWNFKKDDKAIVESI
jgi:lipopolysaccharide cholinephosphotransferase